MELEFKPLIDRYGLEGDFVLLHWQAMPKKQFPAQEEFRIYGAYDSATDTYHSFQSEQWEPAIAEFDVVQLDESLFFSKPVACCLFKDCRLKISGQLYSLEPNTPLEAHSGTNGDPLSLPRQTGLLPPESDEMKQKQRVSSDHPS